MGLFVYDSQHYKDMEQDLRLVRNSCGHLVIAGANANEMRLMVRALTRHKVMVVPTDVRYLTPVVERLMQIANILGIQTVPLASYMARTKTRKAAPEQEPISPAAATAVPPTQQSAVVGEQLNA